MHFEQQNEPPKFGGEPGEPVPAVDPEDLKIAWQISRDVQARHPGRNVAVGAAIFKQACKPGSDIQAVAYRSMMLELMNHPVVGLADLLAPFIEDGKPKDSVFRAAAKVPLEWMGVESREGLPFDVNEFLRLCGEGK